MIKYCYVGCGYFILPLHSQWVANRRHLEPFGHITIRRRLSFDNYQRICSVIGWEGRYVVTVKAHGENHINNH